MASFGQVELSSPAIGSFASARVLGPPL